MANAATMKGPGVFLSQFIGDVAPFDTLAGLAGWAAGIGFRGVMVPTHDARILDVDAIADSPARADELRGLLADHGLVLSELAAHRFGWLLAYHPAYAVAAGPTHDCGRSRAPALRSASPAAPSFRARWSGPMSTRGRYATRD
jgi:hypothetical protein